MKMVSKRWTLIVLLAVAMMSGGCSTLNGILGHDQASSTYTDPSYGESYAGGYASGGSYLGGSGSC